jgi:hypothetical protein
MRRHPLFDEERSLKQIFKNLRPEYQEYIRPEGANTLDALLDKALEFEELKTRRQRFKSPPRKSDTTWKEEAWTPSKEYYQPQNRDNM